MNIYKLKNGRGLAEIKLAGSMLEWTDETEKVSSIRLAEPLPSGIDSIGARIHYKSDKPYPMPEVYSDTFLTYVSEKVASLISSFRIPEIEFIPIEFLSSGQEQRNGVWHEAKLEEYPHEIGQKYYALHISAPTTAIDQEATLMSSEYISNNPEVPPGNYLSIRLKPEELSPIFVLPGRFFGILVTENLIKICKKEKIKGVGKQVLFNSENIYEVPNIDEVDTKYIVTFKEAMSLFQAKIA